MYGRTEVRDMTWLEHQSSQPSRVKCSITKNLDFILLALDSLISVGQSFVGGTTTLTCKIHAGDQPNLVSTLVVRFTVYTHDQSILYIFVASVDFHPQILWRYLDIIEYQFFKLINSCNNI